MRKRKVTYPTARTSLRTSPAARFGAEAATVRSTVATINLAALEPRHDLSVGDSVRIVGGGLGSGEIATLESMAGGVIPAAAVRLADGRTRRVRLVDLELIAPERRTASEM